MNDTESIKVKVEIDGIDAAKKKADRLFQTIKEAKSLADDLATTLESVETKFKS